MRPVEMPKSLVVHSAREPVRPFVDPDRIHGCPSHEMPVGREAGDGRLDGRDLGDGVFVEHEHGDLHLGVEATEIFGEGGVAWADCDSDGIEREAGFVEEDVRREGACAGRVVVC